MRMQAKTLLAAILAVTPFVVPPALLAQAPGAPTAQGPIDIVAEEQEFAGDQVIAKGNVRVKYKDSIVLAPMAQLYRDGGGNPQRAIFTGHPHLTQGSNKIDAEKLTFEMASSKVIAEGRAHSEVVDQANENKDGKGAAAPAKKPANGGNTPKATDSDDSASMGSGDSDAPKAATKSDTAKPADKKEAPEKIVTDSDRQEYDRATGKFEAIGHVRVVHGNILVKADKLQLVYGLDNKPETALFTGNVAATQDRNTTLADNMVYSLATRRLQATGHVKSTVIQEKKKDAKGNKTNSLGFDIMPSAMAAAPVDDENEPFDDIVVITSDTQDYGRTSNKMNAAGNVRVYYKDMIGAGPAAVLIRNQTTNKAERVVFSGRSQISQPGKRWIADHIEMTIADKKVLATGNTRALILQTPDKKQYSPETQLAGNKSKQSIAATKGEPTR